METKSKLEVNDEELDEELKRLNAVIGDDNEIMYFPGIARAIILDAHMNHEDPVELARDYMENAQQQAAQMAEGRAETLQAAFKEVQRSIQARDEIRESGGKDLLEEGVIAQITWRHLLAADKGGSRDVAVGNTQCTRQTLRQHLRVAAKYLLTEAAGTREKLEDVMESLCAPPGSRTSSACSPCGRVPILSRASPSC